MTLGLRITVALAAVLAAGACRGTTDDCAKLPVAEVVELVQSSGLAEEAGKMLDAQSSDNSVEQFGSARVFGVAVERMARVAGSPKCASQLPDDWAAKELRDLARLASLAVPDQQRVAYLDAVPLVRHWLEKQPKAISPDQFRETAIALLEEVYWTRLDPDFERLRVIDAGKIVPLMNVEELRERNLALTGIVAQVRKGTTQAD